MAVLKVPSTMGKIEINLDDEKLTQFEQFYYPLTNHTADMFFASFSKELKNRILQSQDVKEIESLYQEGLNHYLSLIHG